jgi:hypothetical protein
MSISLPHYKRKYVIKYYFCSTKIYLLLKWFVGILCEKIHVLHVWLEQTRLNVKHLINLNIYMAYYGID